MILFKNIVLNTISCFTKHQNSRKIKPQNGIVVIFFANWSNFFVIVPGVWKYNSAQELCRIWNSYCFFCFRHICNIRFLHIAGTSTKNSYLYFRHLQLQAANYIEKSIMIPSNVKIYFANVDVIFYDLHRKGGKW